MMTIIQDIPISIMSAEAQHVLVEPDIGEPSVRLVAPPLRSLSNVGPREAASSVMLFFLLAIAHQAPP